MRLNQSILLHPIWPIILLVTGCVTTSPLVYAPSSDGSAGYFAHQKEVYKWMVGTYYNLDHQTPQQAANIVMRRAAEIGKSEGLEWMRILNYKTEQRKGPIGSLPASAELRGNVAVIHDSMTFYGNRDEWVSDRQFRQGVNYALVEYIEFSRKKIDCQTEKCGSLDFFIEKCGGDWDGGKKELTSMCTEMAKAKLTTEYEECIDQVKFVTKDFCISVRNAAYKIRGMVEERELGSNGAWYRTDDILEKYSARTDKWANRQKER